MIADMSKSIFIVGWTMHREPNGVVVVKYVPLAALPSYNFEFDDAESANIFWEIVYPLSVVAEHDPYITDDKSGWSMRSVLTPWYSRTMKSDKM